MFKFSELKELTEIADGDFWEVRGAIEALEGGDGSHDSLRIIHADVIDRVMFKDLEADEFLIGCFTPWALADALEMDLGLVERLQELEQLEALGLLVIRTEGALERLVEIVVSNDGYGPHFAQYDGEEHAVGDFFVFKTA